MLTRPVRGEVGEGDGVPPHVAREEGDGILGLGLGQGLAEAGVEGAEVVAGDASVAVVVEEVEDVAHGGHLLRGERDLAAVVEDAARVAVLVLAVGGQDLVVGVVVGCGEEAGVLVGEGRGEGGEVRGRAVRGGLRRPRRRRGAEEVVVVGGGGGDARGVRHGRELGEVGLAVLAQGADLVLEEDAARAAGEPRGGRRPLGARAPAARMAQERETGRTGGRRPLGARAFAARVAQEGETGRTGDPGWGGRGRRGKGNCCCGLNGGGRRRSPSINVDDTRVRHDDDERTAATRGEGERTANRADPGCGTRRRINCLEGRPERQPSTSRWRRAPKIKRVNIRSELFEGEGRTRWGDEGWWRGSAGESGENEVGLPSHFSLPRPVRTTATPVFPLPRCAPSPSTGSDATAQGGRRWVRRRSLWNKRPPDELRARSHPPALLLSLSPFAAPPATPAPAPPRRRLRLPPATPPAAARLS
jgi:hypothetical protein